ncbi:RdgB/HAM1 family non-canonical purine NTP pyrophosphatase [Candidatus Woesearchaeota archaeon]|nr:RdgB/HAM1 family non-canonical purine NTP pyrophosphatase [Candidatus Woesearchaeota archaeon]
MKLIFVTGNNKKLEEARKILSGFEIENTKLDIPEIQEEIHEVIKDKAKKATALMNKPCFVEDTSLCFNALKGLPGQYIKEFLDKLGLKGVCNLLATYDDKSAEAVCMVGYCEPGKEPVILEGKVKGAIVEPRGKIEFGWDPIFQPEGYEKTFAEMTQEEKNAISHRKKALIKFKEFLDKGE